MNRPSIVWVRNDLRFRDNPALVEASKTGAPIILLYILSTDSFPLGTASKVWLHYSLIEYIKNVEAMGLRCIIRKGDPTTVLKEVARESGAGALFWNRAHEPEQRSKDQAISKVFDDFGLEVITCPGNYLFEPGDVMTKERKPFQVFTPFWNHCLKMQEAIAKPLAAPSALNPFKGALPSFSIESLGLVEDPSLASQIGKIWTVGETAAHNLLNQFDSQVYEQMRDFPAVDGTSKLSAFLHYGQISAREVWHTPLSSSFLRQIGWREFALHLLHHFPDTPWRPLRKQFEHFEWRVDPEGLEAWKKGMTGYPLVDAGMRQLLHTGWMHNRVRMVVGSFLVKHLLISWVEGEKWFWERLFDADLANNTFGWQWVGGCGADAAPYFRIFNPVLQGEKFDPDGAFVKQWVPELAHLPAKVIHHPWDAPKGATAYPSPIISLEEGRKRALAAYHNCL